MYIVYIRSRCIYMCYVFETHSLLAIQRAAVKDSSILNKCVWQLLKSVLLKRAQHMLEKKCVIFIANVSSTIIFFFLLISVVLKKNTKWKKELLIYFILYTSSAFTNYFSNWCAFFFPLKPHALSFSLKGRIHPKAKFIIPTMFKLLSVFLYSNVFSPKFENQRLRSDFNMGSSKDNVFEAFSIFNYQ